MKRKGWRGDWMRTSTGKKFYPFDPQPEDICIEDIAAGLSKICRYAGQCRDFYSVAEHSLLVTQLLNRADLSIYALLHDASEAYLVDLPKPVKVGLKDYQALESRVTQVIYEKYAVNCVSLQDEHALKWADTYARHLEQKALMPNDDGLFNEESTNELIHCLDHKLAYSLYLNAFHSIYEPFPVS